MRDLGKRPILEISEWERRGEGGRDRTNGSRGEIY